MIGNLAQIIAQAQGGLDSANLPPAGNAPSNGGNVVGAGTNVNDLSYFSDPMGVDAKSADEVRSQATSNMMGQSQMPSSPINPQGFSRPEEEITQVFKPEIRQEDLMNNPTKLI